jgi:hypothetical protein
MMTMPTLDEEFVLPTRRHLWDSTALRVFAVLLLLTAAPLYEAFRVAAFSSDDIWWHLSTGLWILQNHAFPRHGLFSQSFDSPWIDSSWGFQVLLALAYKLLGLRAICLLLMVLKSALAAVTFLLAGGWRRNFWVAVLLSVAAQYILVNLQPLPLSCSMLFFGIELLLLLKGRRDKSVRPLFWLPLLFLVWANLHVQFANGLLLLVLFLAADITERLLRRAGLVSSSVPAYSLAKAGTAAGLCLLATLITPYGFQLFPEVMATAYGAAQFKFYAEVTALDFRHPQHFAFLLLVMAAFLALGRQHSRDIFKIGTMTVFAMLAFRVQRDVWCVLFPAIAIISDAMPDGESGNELPESRAAWKFEKPLAVGLSVLVVLLAFVRVPSNQVLMSRAAAAFPIKACDFIRANRLPDPLFNSYAWGGFLTWYLPEYPVAIDTRLGLYGSEANEQYVKTVNGEARLEANPSFVQARTILLERGSGLTKALTTIPFLRDQFRVVYQDDLAVVLVRQ